MVFLRKCNYGVLEPRDVRSLKALHEDVRFKTVLACTKLKEPHAGSVLIEAYDLASFF